MAPNSQSLNNKSEVFCFCFFNSCKIQFRTPVTLQSISLPCDIVAPHQYLLPLLTEVERNRMMFGEVVSQ